jgi:SNF2 family DNA or RNA helicase
VPATNAWLFDILAPMRAVPPGDVLEDDASGKFAVLRALLRQWAPSHRVLVFSFSTKMLNLAQRLVASMRMSFCRIDGSVTAANRAREVAEFNKGLKEVFLISTKAGGTGLNLTAADRVGSPSCSRRV